jgi:hypothetical protein
MTDFIDSFGRGYVGGFLGDAEAELERHHRSLGDPDVAGSFSPYAPFTANSVPSTGGASGSEGQLATHILTDVLAGNHIDVSAYAAEAGAIAGGVAGSAIPGIGTILGAVIGGAVGKVIGGIIAGGGDDCDAACGATQATPQVAAQICVVRETGKIDPVCQDAVYWALRNKFDCMFEVGPWPTGANRDGCLAIMNAWKQPFTPDGNERAFMARLGEAAAARRLNDDIDWSKRIIVAANNAAGAYGPDCPSCDPACLELVKATAIDYAVAAHPYGQGSEQASEGFAHQSMSSKMKAVISSSVSAHSCPTLGEKSGIPDVAKLKAKCLTYHGMSWADGKGCVCAPPNVYVAEKNGDAWCGPAGSYQEPQEPPAQAPGDTPEEETPKGHGLLFKGAAAVLAAGAVYSGVQFARGKPNQIATQGKKIYGIAKSKVQKMRR